MFKFKAKRDFCDACELLAWADCEYFTAEFKTLTITVKYPLALSPEVKAWFSKMSVQQEKGGGSEKFNRLFTPGA